MFIHEAFLKNNETINEIKNEKEPKKSRKGAEKELKKSQKGAKKEPKKGAEIKQNILDKLAENPTMTQTKLMEEFALSRKQIQNAVRELREDGLLEREGSNRKGKWIVRK